MNIISPALRHNVAALAELRSVPHFDAAVASISIVGLGYVGAVSSACFSSLGHPVVGVDVDTDKVRNISEGISPIVEEGLGELINAGLEQELLSATTDLYAAVLDTDITMVCVGTPTRPDGSVHLGYLEAVSDQIGAALAEKDGYHTVVIRSTIAPGVTRNTVIPRIEKASGKTAGKGFGICFHPEFLRESTAIADFFAPPKTVIGSSDDRAADTLARLYEGIPGPMIKTSIEAAEMVKYVDNTWHALKVSFANEVGRVCKANGIDSHDVMDIFCQDTKLNLSPYYMKPGFAFGGSCLPKDVRAINALADRSGVDTPLLRSITHSNTAQIEHALNLIEASGATEVGFLGVTFKKDTDDLRESPTLILMAQLMDAGYTVKAYDESLAVSRNVASQAEYLAKAAPHLASVLDKLDTVLVDSAQEMIGGPEILVVSHATDTFRDLVDRRDEHQKVVDLVRLERRTDRRPSYQGICW